MAIPTMTSSSLNPQGESVLVGYDTSGTPGYLWRERVTSGFPVITTDHGLIHEGIAYTATTTITASANASGYIQFQTASGSYTHFKPAGFTATGGPVTITLREDITCSGGSAVTAYNRNRLSALTSSATIKTGVTPTASGTVFATLLIPSSTQGSQQIGAATNAAEEWVLKQGAVYGFKWVCSSVSDITLGIDCFWYEETGA